MTGDDGEGGVGGEGGKLLWVDHVPLKLSFVYILSYSLLNFIFLYIKDAQMDTFDLNSKHLFNSFPVKAG